MDRTINVTVTGEFVRKDSKNAGVQGEANVTGLHIVMSDDWEAFSKRIIWRNALGESPVAVLLYNSVEDLVAKKDPLTFDTAIPAEPLALEGWCSFTIEGFRESNPTAVAITVTDHLLVKPNDAYTTPKEPTPTQAQQLQTQIDGIVPQVSTLVGNAIEALEQAEEAVKVWEAYDSAKTYLPLQKVSRLGSSYICKAACKGVAPERAGAARTARHRRRGRADGWHGQFQRDRRGASAVYLHRQRGPGLLHQRCRASMPKHLTEGGTIYAYH